MNKEEIKASAKKHFDSNADHKKYFVTVDGMCFPHWHDANEHSKVLGNRTIEEVDREGTKTKSVAERIAEVNAATTPEELEAVKPGNKEHISIQGAYKTQVKAFEVAGAKDKAAAEVKADAEVKAAEKIKKEKK